MRRTERSAAATTSSSKKSSRTYPLFAQPCHHRTQTGGKLSRSGAADDGVSSTFKPPSDLYDLVFKSAVLLLKAASLEGAVRVQSPSNRNEK